MAAPFSSRAYPWSAGFQPAPKGSAAKMAKLPKGAAKMAALRDRKPAGKP